MDKFHKLQKINQDTKKKETIWALKNFVNLDAMYACFEKVHDFKRRLVGLGLKIENMRSEFEPTQHNYEILKIAISSGLIDQLSLSEYRWLDQKRFEKIAKEQKIILRNTVIVKSSPNELFGNQEVKSKIDHTFRQCGPISNGLIKIDDDKFFIEYTTPLGIMLAIKRKEGDS